MNDNLEQPQKTCLMQLRIFIESFIYIDIILQNLNKFYS